jgi:hypothetical protein
LNVYTLYIEDDRYSVPSIDILMASSDEQAEELAGLRLASSPHYLSVAVWRDEQLVCELADPGASDAAADAADAP